jgi:hypothetical protein
MSTGPDPERTLEQPAVGPAYGGTGDPGVVSSVGEHAPATGDVVDALAAEHRKLQAVFDDIARLLRTDERHALTLRWGGVVRELLEHEVAEERVVLPAAEKVAGAGAVEEVRRRSRELLARLRDHDSFTPDDVSAQDVGSVLELAAEHLRTVDAVVLPLLEQLPSDERVRLGEDFRQVMG